MRHRWLAIGAALSIALGPGAPALRGQDTQPADAAPPPASQPAASQESAPTDQATDDAPRTPSLLDIDELSFELGFDASYRRRQVITDDVGRYRFRDRQVNEATRFDETLGLTSDGSILGERVLQYDLAARWGLTQESFYEQRPGQDLSDDRSGNLLEYDVRMTLFPAGRISATAYASQGEDRIPRQFLPSLDRRRERFGGGLFYNDPILPMRLTFDHEFERLESRSDLSDRLMDDEDRGRDRLAYEATWQPDPFHALRLQYEYVDQEEKYSGSGTRFDTVRNELTLDHTIRFGLDHRSQAQTLLRFQDETGDLARDQYEAALHLRLQHSPSFATTYRLQYLQERFQQLELEQWRGDIGLVHQLGQHLTSTLNLHGLHQNTSVQQGRLGGSPDTTDWGATANASFSFDNSAGRFSGNLSYAHSHVNTSDGGRGGIVIAEAVTLRDPLATYLAQRNVEIGSIVVTNQARTRTYLPVRDFVVLRHGDFTALLRVRSGQIADGQTVYVSYTYRAFDDFEAQRDRADLRLQQDFSFGLTPYYAGSLQNEQIDRTRFLTFTERNVNRHRLGLRYRQRRWSSGIEYEYNDDSIDPYQAVHATADATLLEDARSTLAANTALSYFDFEGNTDLDARSTTLFDAGMSYRYLLGRDLEASTAARYRYENDGLYGQTHGVDVTAGVSYKIGLFSLSLEVEYDLLDLEKSSDSDVAVWLKLRRSIPVLARRP